MKKEKIDFITKITDTGFAIIIFCAILSLVIFSFRAAFDLFLQSVASNIGNIVHNVAYIIVLLKAYKILIYYFRYQNLSIKYLVQIAIIAPAIEVIFAVNQQSIWVNVLFATFSVANLLIYIFFYKKFDEFDVFDQELYAKSHS